MAMHGGGPNPDAFTLSDTGRGRLGRGRSRTTILNAESRTAGSMSRGSGAIRRSESIGRCDRDRSTARRASAHTRPPFSRAAGADGRRDRAPYDRGCGGALSGHLRLVTHEFSRSQYHVRLLGMLRSVAQFWEAVTGYPKRACSINRATTTGWWARPMEACRGWCSSPCPRRRRPRTVCTWTCCRKARRVRKKRSPASSTSAPGLSTTAAIPSPGGWIVMADPEGNEFCVEPEPS